MDLLVSNLAHFEQAAAGADVALLDLVGAVHDRRACHRRDTQRGYIRATMQISRTTKTSTVLSAKASTD
jgi:hypothetical protein